MAEVFSEPYTPNLVPQAQLNQNPLVQLRDLERFLAEELERIQTAMLLVPVQAAYGGLTVAPGPVADQPLDGTPALIVGWNNTTPLVPNRVDSDPVTSNSLTVSEGGVFLILMQITAAIAQGRNYEFRIYENGVPTALFVEVDASQQTDVITVTLNAMLEVDPGDFVQLFGEAEAAGSPHQFIMESAILSAIRISELHRDRTP
jgi:hypothetical protein